MQRPAMHVPSQHGAVALQLAPSRPQHRPLFPHEKNEPPQQSLGLLHFPVMVMQHVCVSIGHCDAAEIVWQHPALPGAHEPERGVQSVSFVSGSPLLTDAPAPKNEKCVTVAVKTPPAAVAPSTTDHVPPGDDVKSSGVPDAGAVNGILIVTGFANVWPCGVNA